MRYFYILAGTLLVITTLLLSGRHNLQQGTYSDAVRADIHYVTNTVYIVETLDIDTYVSDSELLDQLTDANREAQGDN